MKKNIKIKNTICIILMAILLAITTKVYASDSFKTSIKANNSTVKQGENVTITIGLKDIAIESGEKGIGAYTAKIDFDSSVFEYVSTKGTDKWETPLYQEKSIVGNTNDGEVVNTNQSIGTVTLKVKDDATVGNTTIKLTNFLGSTAESDVKAQDTSVTLSIVAKDNGSQSESGSGSEGGNQSGNQSGSETEKGDKSESGSKVESGEKSPSTSKDKNESGTGTDVNEKDQSASENLEQNGTTQSESDETGADEINKTSETSAQPEKLPQTGGHSNTLIYVLIGIFLFIIIIFGIRIRNINKKAKR